MCTGHKTAYCALRLRLCFIDMINTAIPSTRPSADQSLIAAATAAHSTLLPLPFDWQGSAELGSPSSLSKPIVLRSWIQGAVEASSNVRNRKRHIYTTSPEGQPVLETTISPLADLRSALHGSEMASNVHYTCMSVLVKDRADDVICGCVSPSQD